MCTAQLSPAAFVLQLLAVMFAGMALVASFEDVPWAWGVFALVIIVHTTVFLTAACLRHDLAVRGGRS